MKGPLEGVRVLDFGMAAVGPISTTYLGVLGADVIKIEQPSGDIVRRPTGVTMKGMGTTFIGNNCTKRGIVLDLKQEGDRAIAYELVRRAHVVMDNFRSGDVMVRLGLGYDVLSGINPQIIYLQSSAYGNVGPMKGMVSYDHMTQAAGGYVSMNGRPGGRPECSRGTARLDWNAANINCIGLLIALYVAKRTGRGMYIETNQFHSTVMAGLTRFAEYFATGVPPAPMGSARPNIVPDQAFGTALGYISVSVLNDRIWRRFCEALGLGDVATDRRFATNPARVAHRDELVPLLEDVFSKKAAWQWARTLREHRVPCGEFFQDRPETHLLMEHPQVIANHMADTIETPWGRMDTHFAHWRFSKSATSITRPAPMLDEHREEILAELGLAGSPAMATV